MKVIRLLALTLLAVPVMPVTAQQGRGVAPSYPSQPAPVVVGPAVGSDAQARLMARRAAITDAQRQLAEMIYGVRIDSQTTVRDFVTENDSIRSNISAVIRGAQVVDTRYLQDGVCEVDMELPVSRVAGVVGTRVAYSGDVFRATGTGVPNPVIEQERPEVIVPEAEPDWRALIISATGTGAVPPRMAGTGQGFAMAKRAATLDAYRNLGENIQGVRINSDTFVRNFVTESDEIRSRFEGYIRGAQIVETRELPDGIVEVEMQIALDGLGNILPLPSVPSPRPQPNYPPQQGYQQAPQDAYRATGQGAPAAPPSMQYRTAPAPAEKQFQQ